MQKDDRDRELLLATILTWSSIFAGAILAAVIVAFTSAPAETPERTNEHQSQEVRAVAQAVVRQAVGFQNQHPSYGPAIDQYVTPQRSERPCPSSFQRTNCQLITLEMQ
ncbi:hypothetical protein A8B75_14355 [Sphingomonadales bacterium EhC05]|jgi:hypothetical protein|nr:hypothetical protein A8B75_14355 [Sphingomonadales bacterium EhC05]